jgi:hypothetical protein
MTIHPHHSMDLALQRQRHALQRAAQRRLVPVNRRRAR